MPSSTQRKLESAPLINSPRRAILAAIYPAIIDTALPTAYVRNSVGLELANRAISSALSAPDKAAPANTTSAPSAELVTTSKSAAIRTALIEIDDIFPPSGIVPGIAFRVLAKQILRVLAQPRTVCPA